LESLRGCVLILPNELLGKPPPHQRLRFGIGAQVISSLADDALVEFVQVDVPDADFGFGFETSAAIA
jgi:hypothetical protein